jgi:hypothetical protein
MKNLSAMILSIALLATLSVAAFASSGTHFTSVSQSINSSGQLVVNFSLVGLGNSAGSVSITVSGETFTADWGCVNGGGNHPKATNKSTTSGAAAATGVFSVSSNGHASGSLTTTPAPSTANTCPGGMTLKLLDVTYSGGTISGGGASFTLPSIKKVF